MRERKKWKITNIPLNYPFFSLEYSCFLFTHLWTTFVSWPENHVKQNKTKQKILFVVVFADWAHLFFFGDVVLNKTTKKKQTQCVGNGVKPIKIGSIKRTERKNEREREEERDPSRAKSQVSIRQYMKYNIPLKIFSFFLPIQDSGLIKVDHNNNMIWNYQQPSTTYNHHHYIYILLLTWTLFKHHQNSLYSSPSSMIIPHDLHYLYWLMYCVCVCLLCIFYLLFSD